MKSLEDGVVQSTMTTWGQMVPGELLLSPPGTLAPDRWPQLERSGGKLMRKTIETAIGLALGLLFAAAFVALMAGI